jgi:long-chain acyl-CoA synthetase
MKTLVERLHEQRRADPHAVLTIAQGRSWTRAEIDDLSTSAARGLLDTGLLPGDRVAIHLANGIDIVTAYYACFKAGLIAVPINTRLKAPEIDYVLRHSAARAYIGQRDLFAEAQGVSASVPLRYLVGDNAEGLQRFSDLISPHAPAAFAAPGLDSPAMILYTSGTTARPKGVTHTHRSLAATAEMGTTAMFEPADRAGVILPMVHMAAVTLFFSAAISEMVSVVVPFEPNGVLDAIETHRITVLLGMPALYRMLIEAQLAKPRDVSSLRACLVGGDSAPAALHEQCVKVLGVPLTEGYGLTEAVPIAFNGKAGRRPGSLGQALPQIEWRLVDGDGREVPRGEVGQVTVRSTLVCSGYWNDPDATGAALKDGWLHTGDLARQDHDGFYWFAGRSKEIIIRGGSNVSPQEVEEALYQHPAVREVAVVGKPDDKWGEIIVAFVALKDNASVTSAELIAFAAERIANYKLPETIIFESALPKGPTGKVARRPLRERLATNG